MTHLHLDGPFILDSGKTWLKLLTTRMAKLLEIHTGMLQMPVDEIPRVYRLTKDILPTAKRGSLMNISKSNGLLSALIKAGGSIDVKLIFPEDGTISEWQDESDIEKVAMAVRERLTQYVRDKGIGQRDLYVRTDLPISTCHSVIAGCRYRLKLLPLLRAFQRLGIVVAVQVH